MTLATGAAASAGGSGFTLLILALPILFLLFLMFSQRRRARAVNDAQQSLAPGQEVMTTAGMYGVVRAIETDTDTVHLEVADGVVLRYQRRAILPLSMVPGGGPASSPSTPTDDEPTDGPGEEPRR